MNIHGVDIRPCVCLGHAKISVAISRPRRGHAQAEQEVREGVVEGDETGMVQDGCWMVWSTTTDEHDDDDDDEDEDEDDDYNSY